MSTADVMLPPEKLKCSSSSEPSVSRLVNQRKNNGNVFFGRKNKKAGNSNFKLNSVKPCEGSHAVARKKKNKNRKKRKWKPYSKLTWEERRELEERDARRATRIREEMTAFGLTLAPYNTTQFLMEDHNLQEPDYEHIPNGHRHRENSHSVNSSDEFYSSPEDEEEFLQREFVQTYENIHFEHLNSLSKVELVQELVNLEDKVESLEKSLKEARLKNTLNERTSDVEAELEKIRVFREEIEKLQRENDVLSRENEKLRKRLPQNT